jgi:signal transduction histidine kinase
MPLFSLTPTSLVYLAQLLVLLVIWYFLFLLTAKQNYQPWLLGQIRRLTRVFMVYSLMVVAMFITESVEHSWYVLPNHLINPLLALTLILWIEFTYYFPRYQPAWHREVRVVRLLSLLYLGFEVAFAIYRYAMLAEGLVIYRSMSLEYMTAAVLFWALVVLARQTVLTSRQAGPTRSWLMHLFRPAGEGVAARSFLMALSLLWLITVVDSLVFLDRRMLIWRDLIVPILMLVGISSLALAYMNYFPEISSLWTKVAVVAVVALLSALGLTGVVIAPALVQNYQQTHPNIYMGDLRFAPDDQGGYVARRLEAPPLPVGNAAVDLEITNDRSLEITLPFPFAFGGEMWESIHVFGHGVLTFAPTANLDNFDYRYGPVPALFVHYRTPNKLPGWSNRVLVTAQPDRLFVTWYELEKVTQADIAPIVLQAILHKNGSFDLISQNVQSSTLCPESGYRECSSWFTGLTPGLGYREIAYVDFGTGDPVRVAAATATIQDYGRDLRSYMHPAMLSLAVLMLVSLAFTLISMHFVLNRVLVRPLHNLTIGLMDIRERNRFDRVLPVYFRDELGFATETFNYMAGELNRLLSGLEERVQQRTEELITSNQRLENEINQRMAVQVKLEQLNQELETNVTHRTQDLLTSQERFLQVITSISDHVFALRVLADGRDEALYSSPRLADLTNLTAPEVAGNFFAVALRLAHPDDRKALSTFWANLCNDAGIDGSGELEFRLFTHGKAVLWLRISARVQIDENENERIIYGVTSDITQRKEAEQATAEVRALAELDKLRTELIGSISHELRTPLGLIKAASTTLLRQDVTFPIAVQRKILQDISSKCDQLEHQVANLLDMARLDQKRFVLHYTPTDLCHLLRAQVAATQRRLRIESVTHQRLILNLPDEPLVATLDALKYEQVVHNLLENAIRYSPPDSTVTLTLHGDETICELRVADQGIGIALEEIKHIFERFYRARDERVQRIRGTGLGLAICREIVGAHGGALSVESVPDQGTIFIVTMPLAPPIDPSQDQ